MPNCITGKARKLKGDGGISYVIAKDVDGLYLRITDNDEEGTFTDKPIHLCTLFDRIVEASTSDAGCFKPKDLWSAIPDENNNDPGFVVAILMDIRFVEPAGHDKYRFRRGVG